ncbi:MAG: anti-sigma factor antagonist [Verrucomicrobiota bacterium]
MEARNPTTHNLASALNAACVISEEWMGPLVVVRAAGVLDMLTSPQLEVGIATALAKNPSAIIVDLNHVDFLASAGMGVLVAAQDKAAPAVKFAVVASGPATSRPLKMVGLAELIGLYPTLDEALAAVGE